MKAFLLVSLLMAGAAVFGQVPVPPVVPQAGNSKGNSGLTFEARLVSSGGTVKMANGGIKNSTLQSFENTQTRENKSRVEVAVRNLSTLPAQARFDWFFVAREVPSRREFVWDQGQRDVAVTPGAEQKETLESKPLAETTRRKTEYTAQNSLNPQQVTQQSSTEQSGGRPSGWIVRMWDGDHLLQVQASSSDLEAIGRDPVRLGKLTGAPAGAPPH